MKRPLAMLGPLLLVVTRVSFLFTTSECLYLSMAGVVTAAFFYLTKLEQKTRLALACFTIALGFLIGARYQGVRLDPFKEREGTAVLATGVVEEARQSSGKNRRYSLYATFEEDLPSATIVVNDYAGEELEIGEKVTLLIELRQPTYGSTKGYHQQAGIPTEGRLIAVNHRTWDTGNIREALVQKRGWARREIHDKIEQALPQDTAALVNGMVFGMTEDLTSGLYRAFNRVGTSHLISVSGLHLSIVTGAILLLFRQWKGLRKIGIVTAMLVAIAFTFLVGANPPMVRSLTMTLLFLLSSLLREQGDSLTTLGISAVIISVVWPYWTLSLGLWLSFLSTFGIITLGSHLQALWKEKFVEEKSFPRLRLVILSGLAISVGAYVFTFPLLVATSGFLPIISPLANILTAPFSTVIVLGGGLLGILPTTLPFYTLVSFFVHLSGRMISEISFLLAKLPFAALSIKNLGILCAFIMGVILLAAGTYLQQKKGKPYFAVGFLSCVILLGAAQGLTLVSQRSQVRVTFFSDSEMVVIQHQGAGVVIHPPDRYGTGELLEYLEFSGVRQLDLVVMPNHQGNYHSGMRELREEIPITAIVSSDDPVESQLLSEYFPGVPVYLGKSQRSNFFANSTIEILQEAAPIYLEINGQTLIITKEIHGEGNHPNTAVIQYQDQYIWLPQGVSFEKNPLAEGIFGGKIIVL